MTTLLWAFQLAKGQSMKDFQIPQRSAAQGSTRTLILSQIGSLARLLSCLQHQPPPDVSADARMGEIKMAAGNSSSVGDQIVSNHIWTHISYLGIGVVLSPFWAINHNRTCYSTVVSYLALLMRRAWNQWISSLKPLYKVWKPMNNHLSSPHFLFPFPLPHILSCLGYSLAALFKSSVKNCL